MPHISVKFMKFTVDRGRFTKALSDHITELMLRAGLRAFTETRSIVPVYTGESQGALTALGRTFGAPDYFPDSVAKRRQKNRWTHDFKSASSGFGWADVDGPARTTGNTISMNFSHFAEGLHFGDKHAVRSPSSPFNFTVTFTQRWKAYLKHEIAMHPELPIKKFLTRQRAY